MNRFRGFLVLFVAPLLAVGLMVLNSIVADKKHSGIGAEDSIQYSADIQSAVEKLEMIPGEERTVPVTVTNTGKTVWIPNEKSDIVLSYHIKRIDGEIYLYEGRRTRLPSAVRPGESVSVDALVAAPEEPGDYLVELDMVHEGHAWFADKGSSTLIVELKVK